MVDRTDAVVPFAPTLEWILTGRTVFYDSWGDRASYNHDGSYLYELPSRDWEEFVPAPGYEFFDGARQINYESPRIDEYLIYDNNLWLINSQDQSSIARVQEDNPGGWGTYQAPIFESLDMSSEITGQIIAISRDEQSIGTAETYYVSTVQDRGWQNDGIYDGFANVEVNFAPEQSMGFVTVDFLNDREMDSENEFSLIVQADPNNPIDTYLAHTTFTVPALEEQPDDDDSGQNSVVFDLKREDVIITTDMNGSVSVEKPGGEIDILESVDRINFEDGSLLYDIDSANLGFTYRIYAAAYGRTPDEDGLRFWVDTKDSLTSSEPERDSFDFLAREFLTAPEFLALYGDDPSDMDYVDAMYQNVLDRLPDEDGYDFWVGAMESGLDRADILVEFAESFENQEQTAPNLNDGIWVV